MKQRKFKERQQFKDRLLFFLLWAGLAGAVAGLVRSFVVEQAGMGQALGYMLIAVLLGTWLWWLNQLKLKVSVNEKRIKYKLSPLHRKSKKIEWEEVASCKLVKTPRSASWHGSNVHFGNMKWFSLSGKNGMSITTKDGRRVFIGCSDVDQLAETLEEIKV